MMQKEMGSILSGAVESEESKPLLPSPIKPVFGVFLPLTYSLNNKNDKHVTVGVMGDQSFSTCVSFTAPKKRVVLSYHVWNILRTHFDHIRLALEKRTKVRCILKDITDSSSSEVIVKPMFGKWYVQICDVNNNRLSIFADEWGSFEQYIPCISRYIIQLWREENKIVHEISLQLHSDERSYHSLWWSDRLDDELNAYKTIVKKYGEVVPD